jgi:hypothetical protein
MRSTNFVPRYFCLTAFVPLVRVPDVSYGAPYLISFVSYVSYYVRTSPLVCTSRTTPDMPYDSSTYGTRTLVRTSLYNGYGAPYHTTYAIRLLAWHSYNSYELPCIMGTERRTIQHRGVSWWCAIPYTMRSTTHFRTTLLLPYDSTRIGFRTSRTGTWCKLMERHTLQHTVLTSVGISYAQCQTCVRAIIPYLSVPMDCESRELNFVIFSNTVQSELRKSNPTLWSLRIPPLSADTESFVLLAHFSVWLMIYKIVRSSKHARELSS